MTALEWNKVGERYYQTGIDRGVLYPKNGPAVVWNGLTGVNDGSDSERKSVYMDGMKISERVIPGDFVGSLTALTYPDEFDECVGTAEIGTGLLFYDQPPKSFNLSYRTLIGNDADPDLGYKIHLLYNLLAIADSHSFQTIGAQAEPSEFSWGLGGVPPLSLGHRPTVHVSVDSTTIEPDSLQAIEDILYGTAETDPYFPTQLDLAHVVLGTLTITDNGDGTWTADDPVGFYISMIDADTFQIDEADVIYLDEDTYEISSTGE